MKASIVRFLRDEEGATAIEYGIIAGAMATALILIFGADTIGSGTTASDSFVGALKKTFSTLAGKLPTT